MQLLKNEEVAVEQETLETKSQAVGVNVEYHTQEEIRTYVKEIVADKYVPATCMQDGMTEGSHCDVCHLVIAKQEKISALGHDYCTENMLRPATVTQSGIVTSICSRCEEVQTIEIASVGEVSLSNTSYIYDGKKKQPDVIIKDTTGNVISDKNYQILYENNTNIGQAKVIITLQGNYAGTITKNFSIVLKKGAVIAKGSYNYKITGNTSVSCIGLLNKKTTKATIPSKIVLGGRLFQVTAIADKAFKNTKLTSVIIGSNVKNIGVSAFEGCTKLTKVTVGNKVEKIGKNGFKNCNKLKTLTVQSLKLKSIGKDALKGIKNNAKVKVPAKKWIQYKKLFKGKGQGSKVKICIT